MKLNFLSFGEKLMQRNVNYSPRVCRLIVALSIVSATPSFAASSSTQAIDTYPYEVQWSQCQYTIEKEQQPQCFTKLVEDLHQLHNQYPDNADIQALWGINIASLAGVSGLSKALKLIRQSKEVIEQALEMDPDALNGAPYVTLGAMYYRAPGWPLSFGDDEQAKRLLEKGVERNPNNSSTLYFYADYLASQGEKKKAVEILQRALSLPINTKYKIGDIGRREDIKELLASLQ